MKEGPAQYGMDENGENAARPMGIEKHIPQLKNNDSNKKIMTRLFERHPRL